MINMAHESDDRSAVGKLFFGLFDLWFWLLENFFLLVNPTTFCSLFTLKNKPVSFADFLSNLRFNSLSRSYENLQLYEISHDLESHLAHLFCQIAYNDRRFYADDISIDLTLVRAVIGRTFGVSGRLLHWGRSFHEIRISLILETIGNARKNILS